MGNYFLTVRIKEDREDLLQQFSLPAIISALEPQPGVQSIINGFMLYPVPILGLYNIAQRRHGHGTFKQVLFLQDVLGFGMEKNTVQCDLDSFLINFFMTMVIYG